MFRTLLVPLDGSVDAEAVLPYAVRVATANGGGLALVRVAEGPPPSGMDWERQQLDALDDAKAYLSKVAEMLAERVHAITYAPYGEPAAQILQSVSRLEADAIMMATRARTGLDHWLHGSVAEAVLAHTPVPLFLVQRGRAALPSIDSLAARVLVPLDGSAFAETALPVAAQFVGKPGEIMLVSVAAPPDHVERDDRGFPRAFLDQQEESHKRPAFEYLMDVALRLKRAYPDLAVTTDVRIGEPAPGIVMSELDRNADVVVMSTHGRTGVPRALLGSVAGEVLRTGHVPVVLVGPASAATLAGTPETAQGVVANS